MKRRTVYSTRPLWSPARERLAAVADIAEWPEHHPIPHDELLRQVVDVEGLLCFGHDHVDRRVLEAGRHLRVVATASAGVDHIDLATADEMEILVCHTPGAADDAVADLTMGLLLASARNIVEADAFVREGQWRHWTPELLLGAEVEGHTLGIVGLGNIGVKVAHRALGFGMRVLYHSTTRDLDAEQMLSLQYGELDDLLREADFVTLHVPLTPETRGLIDARRLRLMKPTAFLINLARGAVVEHDALVTALRDGWITGAGLDVFECEPLPKDDPLLQLPNVVLTPHIGANTREAIAAMMAMAAEQISQALQGKTPAHVVRFGERRRRAA